MLDEDIAEVLFTPDKIADAVRRMGEQISRDYAGRELYVVGVLKGAFMFTADLVREISIPLAVDFVGLASYGADTESSGLVRMTKDLDHSIRGKDVLITEGVVDTGLTLDFLVRTLKVRKPATLMVCTLLNKPSRRVVPVEIGYQGYEIPNRFIVGYGMDFRQNYRHLPYIGILKPEVYQARI